MTARTRSISTVIDRCPCAPSSRSGSACPTACRSWPAGWQRALRELGFDVRTVAGDGPVDVLLPGLAIDATEPPSDDELRRGARRGRPRGGGEPLHDPAEPTGGSRGRAPCSPGGRRCCTTTTRRGSAAARARHRAAAGRSGVAACRHQPPHPRRDGVPRHRRRPRSTTASTSDPPPAIATRPDARSASAPTSGSSCTRCAPSSARTSPPRCGWRRRSARRTGSSVRPRTATTTRSRPLLAGADCPVDPPSVPGHDGRRLRRRRRGRLPVDLGGVRQPADRGGDPPASRRGRPLPGGRRAARARLPMVRSRRARRRSTRSSAIPTPRCTTTTGSWPIEHFSSTGWRATSSACSMAGWVP